MSYFEERLQLTEFIEKKMDALFHSETVLVHEYGCKAIVGDNRDLLDYIKEPQVNQQASAMIVKFAPDFILLKKSEPKQLFFIDVKHSISPIWARSRLKMMRDRNHDDGLTVDRIGVVAREALLSYRRFYPNSIILMACPYHSKLLMAQYASQVRCLYCYHSPARGDYDCDNCPSKNGGYFDIERAQDSAGSQTPMTNVDLDSFLPADEFFQKIGIPLNGAVLKEIRDAIKAEPVLIESEKYPERRNKTLWSLNQAGCDWINYEVYSKAGNDFYHIDKQCFWLRDNKAELETYASPMQAKNAGKHTYCRNCCKED